MNDLEIHQLTSLDGPFVSQFFAEILHSRLDRTFHPHDFTEDMAWKICRYEGQDWYAAGIMKPRSERNMAGYVMLRGWDEGYDIPTFGVCVLPRFQGVGVGKALLREAIHVAMRRGAPAVRLKVYPDNAPAIALYRHAGFQFQDQLEHGQMVGYLSLSEALPPRTYMTEADGDHR